MRRKLWMPISLALAVFACAQGNPNPNADYTPIDTTPLPDAGPEAGAFAETGPPGVGDVECAEETKQIYVLGTDKTLYRFYPDAPKFVRIGQIGCPTTEGTFSMGIDRRGTAWIEFTDSQVYAVDTTDASCKPTGFRTNQGFTHFGMGFARNGDTDNGETLYIAGVGLGSLDTKSMLATFLGNLNAGRTELTGRDTELFAFNVASGVITGVDKTNAKSLVTYRTSAVDPAAAFAFAQWGGDFWVFTGMTRSIVTRYQPVEDKSTVVIDDTGMLIVGAGSSTCAPSKPH
jgi:hypothetical protein